MRFLFIYSFGGIVRSTIDGMVGLRILIKGEPRFSEVMKFVCNQEAKSHEILMFVCLQKDAKQCCDASSLIGYSLCWSTTTVVDQHNECDLTLWHHSIVWHLFGDKHQNLTRLSLLVTNKHQNLTRLSLLYNSYLHSIPYCISLQ